MLKDKFQRGTTIYCYHEVQRIEEIRRAGFNPQLANKKSVKDRLDFVKSRKLFIHQNSVNLLKEIKSYKYKEKNNIDEPYKMFDDAMDAAGYASISFKQAIRQAPTVFTIPKPR